MLGLLAALLVAAGFTLVLPIISLIQSAALRGRIDRLERRLRELEHLTRIDEKGARREAPVASPTSPEPESPRSIPVASLSPVSATPAAPPPVSAPEAELLETAIGSRWMLYAGITVLLLGLSFFLKLAIDNEWINEEVRVGLGCAAGLALAAAGVFLAGRGYLRYGRSVSGGGVAVLYFSIYAAFDYYGLVSQQPAFALLILITAGAAMLADRESSQGLALVAVIGGFAAPFLVGREGGSHIVLFAYDAVLIAGTMALAKRRAWPGLNLASFILTLFTVLTWYVQSYRPALYLSFEIFLTIFCLMFLWIRAQGRHSDDPFDAGVSNALLVAPILYHAASLWILSSHATAYLIYLTGFSAAGVAAGVHRRSSPLRLLVWLGVWLPALGWTDRYANAGWLSRILATMAAIYAMHLLAQVKRIIDHDQLDDADLALVHVNGLGLFAGFYLALENAYASWIPAVTFGLAAWNTAVAAGLRVRDPGASLHWVVVAAVLAATALALQLEGVWVTVGWAAEGAGLVWLGLRASRGWVRLAGGLLLTLAALRVVGPDYDAIPSGFTPIANARVAAGAFIVALLYWLAREYRRVRESGFWNLWKTPGASEFSTRFGIGDSGLGSRDSAMAVALVGANVLTLVVLTQEIMAYWPRQVSVGSSLIREALISITWAVYAAGMIAVGIRRAYAPIRYLAILVFGLTVMKIFTVDLANLGGIYRVLGFLVVGAVLLGASFLYQRQLNAERGASTKN